MQPRRKTAMWANDDLMGPAAPAGQGTLPAKQARSAAPASADIIADPIKTLKGQKRSRAVLQQAHESSAGVDAEIQDGDSSGDDSILYEDAAPGNEEPTAAEG